MSDKPFACPECGASNETEASLMCIPVEDECPMMVHENWNEAAAILQAEADACAAPSPSGQVGAIQEARNGATEMAKRLRSSANRTTRVNAEVTLLCENAVAAADFIESLAPAPSAPEARIEVEMLTEAESFAAINSTGWIDAHYLTTPTGLTRAGQHISAAIQKAIAAKGGISLVVKETPPLARLAPPPSS